MSDETPAYSVEIHPTEILEHLTQYMREHGVTGIDLTVYEDGTRGEIVLDERHAPALEAEDTYTPRFVDHKGPVALSGRIKRSGFGPSVEVAFRGSRPATAEEAAVDQERKEQLTEVS